MPSYELQYQETIQSLQHNKHVQSSSNNLVRKVLFCKYCGSPHLPIDKFCMGLLNTNIRCTTI